MTRTAMGWFTGSLVNAHPLTESARSITFAVPGWTGNAAGQHVDVRLTAPDGYQAVRSYSIASVGAGEEIELAIDRLPDGEVSPFLVDDLELGDRVELRGPLGGWFVWRPDQCKPVQLVAGGSGVVPLLAMMRAHTDSGSLAPMRLLYSIRTPDDAFFRDELLRHSSTSPTTWHYSRAVPPGWSRAAGRLTAEDLRVETLPPEQVPLIYICGPTGFVEAVSSGLVELGHSAENIRTERFGGN
ncbi:ferredoxin-NADP reductase [Pseudarthrobacter sp. W1I19]|uniref:ferredoxin reductase n=1 Tax=Pseudarthrobacter sp. W1I19 TaxID=3042288 RepID=UPI00278AA1E5|nr:ferredoxin reductase [Pseudarthrobacter sp. W1I19]MDQ0923822.1 ferredoxin-NADP reductase [Pseudarthrobacter sp. W1I19]